jgi:hypothetical protein
MSSHMIKYLTLLLPFFIVSNLQAQTKKSSDSTTFSIQSEYLSDYIYNGRADSIKYPYQTTTASLHLANGLFSNFSASYLLTPGMKGFDFFELDLGYEYKIGKKIYGELYGTKYFYSGGSNLINGNISSDIGASLNYDFNYFQFNNTIDVFFTNKSDIQFTPGIEKTIYFSSNNESSWSINPYVYSNFSSVNYYESNVSRRLNGPRGPRGGQATGTQLTSSTVVQNKGFKLLNTDFSVPLSYEGSHWLATFTPTYSIPFNKIETITTNTITSVTGTTTNKINSTPYSELYLKNQFYFQIGLTYKF